VVENSLRLEATQRATRFGADFKTHSYDFVYRLVKTVQITNWTGARTYATKERCVEIEK